MTNDGTRAYNWDARNRLTSVYAIPSASVYDPAGRRIFGFVGNAATSFLYDGNNVVEEIQAGSPSATLMTGLGVDQRFSRTSGSATSTYLTDNLGSTVALANSSGTVQTSYAYDPYGVTTTSGAASTNPNQYTGRENNATGLYYNRARYYNPAWGRFISEDPIGLAGGDNLYRYVGCNPIGHKDPSGLKSFGPHPFFPPPLSPPTSSSGQSGGPNGNGKPPQPPCSPGLVAVAQAVYGAGAQMGYQGGETTQLSAIAFDASAASFLLDGPTFENAAGGLTGLVGIVVGAVEGDAGTGFQFAGGGVIYQQTGNSGPILNAGLPYALGLAAPLSRLLESSAENNLTNELEQMDPSGAAGCP